MFLEAYYGLLWSRWQQGEGRSRGAEATGIEQKGGYKSPLEQDRHTRAENEVK